MDKITRAIIKRKRFVVMLFLLITVICMAAATQVKVNYNIMDYLPDEAPSTVSLDIMDEEYKKGTPNARVMVGDVSLPEALEYKDKIAEVSGVKEVMWLDDAADLKTPLEYLEKKTVEEYYVDNNALFTVTVDTDKQEKAIDEIREIIGDRGAMCGNAVNTVTAIELTEKEVQRIMVIAVLIVFIILLFTTTSYIEPVLFLTTIGIAIMLNNGTNLLLGEISFVTNSAGSILQLAVSMDYSIFLLDRFTECRSETDDVNEAMTMAVRKSFGSVMSGGLTTVMGFAALILMKFKIGPDMGIVMAKAIAISLFTVLLFFPSFILLCYKLVDKTRHKSFVPPFDKFTGLVMKIKRPVVIAVLIIALPCYLGQQQNDFTYGQSGIYKEGTKPGDEEALIESIFGKSNLMALMVPVGSPADEQALSADILALDEVTSLLSYSETVGNTIPVEFLPKDTVSDLISGKYSRFIITADTDTEGKEAFGLVEKIRSLAGKYYSNYYFAGETVNSYDMKDVVTEDNVRVNFLSIAAIALILVLNFKSIGIPFILLFIIELSIWINLSIPYFSSENLFYIGYLIISSIQLGATVDYAILFADRYIENRASMNPVNSAKQTLKDASLSVITSASVLTFAGLMLGMLSSNGIISQLGILVGRGGILSGILVLFALPGLLIVLDKFIYRTTYKLDFYDERKESKR